jgi:hypothetical protein
MACFLLTRNRTDSGHVDHMRLYSTPDWRASTAAGALRFAPPASCGRRVRQGGGRIARPTTAETNRGRVMSLFFKKKFRVMSLATCNFIKLVIREGDPSDMDYTVLEPVDDVRMLRRDHTTSLFFPRAVRLFVSRFVARSREQDT